MDGYNIQEMHPTLKKESILSKIYNVESSIETFETFFCRIILIIIRYFLESIKNVYFLLYYLGKDIPRDY